MILLVLALLAQATADPVPRDRAFWLEQDRQQIARDRTLATGAERRSEADRRSVLTRPSPIVQAEQRRIDEAARVNADAASAEASRRAGTGQGPHP